MPNILLGPLKIERHFALNKWQLLVLVFVVAPFFSARIIQVLHISVHVIDKMAIRIVIVVELRVVYVKLEGHLRVTGPVDIQAVVRCLVAKDFLRGEHHVLGVVVIYKDHVEHHREQERKNQ